jgi:hypothetical protein
MPTMPTMPTTTRQPRVDGAIVPRVFARVFAAAMLLSMGCSAPASDADASYNAASTSETAAAGRAAPEVAVEVEALSSIDFDDCCVDLSGVVDCRGQPNAKICTRFRRSGSTTLTCKKKKVSCPAFTDYKCYNHGVAVTGSLPCCSGSAAYNGSALYCK